MTAFSHTNRWLIVLIILTILVASVFHLGSSSSQVNLSFSQLFQSSEKKALIELIFLEIRLPRLLLAILVGFILGTTGAVMQGFLRNPLAGPDLLGVSNCAALGAVIALYFGFASKAWYLLPATGMLGAFIGMALIFLLSGSNHHNLRIILAGVAINAFAASLISIALNLSKNPYAMSEIVFWLMGSLSHKSLMDVGGVFPFILVAFLLLLSSAKFLDALTLGEESAISLGFNLKSEQAKLIIATALGIGAAVSIAGNIGFVGLIVPHLCRPLVKHQPGNLIFLSGLIGSLFMIISDIIVMQVSTTQEIKLGVVTSLVGGPFFLYLILKLGKNHDQP